MLQGGKFPAGARLHHKSGTAIGKSVKQRAGPPAAAGARGPSTRRWKRPYGDRAALTNHPHNRDFRQRDHAVVGWGTISGLIRAFTALAHVTLPRRRRLCRQHLERDEIKKKKSNPRSRWAVAIPFLLIHSFLNAAPMRCRRLEAAKSLPDLVQAHAQGAKEALPCPCPTPATSGPANLEIAASCLILVLAVPALPRLFSRHGRARPDAPLIRPGIEN